MNGINLIKGYLNSNKEVIVFCGAGLSKNIGLPDWKTLAKEILLDVSTKYGIEELQTIIAPMEIGYVDILKALELVSERKYRRDVLEKLEKLVNITTNEFPIHEAIINFTSKIITTNYDIAFEKAAKGNLEVFTSDNNYLVSALAHKSNFLFKIHGNISNPESCILFEEDYERLYARDSSYLFEMIKAFTDKVFLFIGFSLTDPYINKIFDRINDAYKGMTGKHFIITTEANLYDNYKDYLVPIKIDNYSQVIPLFKELSQARTSNTKIEEIEEILTSVSQTEITSVQLYIPQPIDKEIDYNRELIASSFKNYNLVLTESYFNVDKLSASDDVDYIFIFTYLVKGQLVIEDENLKFKLFKFQDLNNLNHSTLKGVFVFLDAHNTELESLINLKDCSIPLFITSTNNRKIKETLTGVLHKAFTKGDLDSLVSSGVLFNHDLFNLYPQKKGDFVRKKQTTYISKFIDKKSLIKFVGRKSDQENIIRKILAIRYENKILTLKGSGGIGKTSTVSKIGIELAERGYFDKGVHFISCNPIQSYENFEFLISQCFNLPSSKFLKDQISETIHFKDRIIILDNFETLLYIAESQDVLDLVSYICDYAVIVITTRQILDLEFEDIYELRSLTTDEGVELFKNIYTSKIAESQERLLRKEIVERLLNNNPLAIKLIAKGLVPSKDLSLLKEELEKNIFNLDNIDDIFDKDEDINIERSTSLYHSINYSYINLSEQEKLAFELLSLFPDGLHMENFKSFFKSSKSSSHKIGDKEIKQLDNKSLLENSNGFLKLQSIISRFSDYKFKSRPTEVKNNFYETAFSFNSFFVNMIASTTRLNNSLSLFILDLNTNNYLKCLEYMNFVSVSNKDKLIFISEVSKIFRDTNQPNKFIDAIRTTDIKLDDDSETYVDLIINNIIYWTKDFDETLSSIEDAYPFEKLVQLDPNNDLHRIIISRVCAIYKAEGRDLDVLRLYVETKNYNYPVADSLYKLGYEKEALLLTPKQREDKDYFDFEVELVNNTISLEEVIKNMSSLYKKETLEMTQMTYLKSKVMTVTNSDIKKLVISNPYTKGLIHFMQAKNETDTYKKIRLFEQAKTSLFHIKYHYVECIIEYLRFLEEIKLSDEYALNWNEAVRISEQYLFRKKLHELQCMNGSVIPFNNKYHKIPIEYSEIRNHILQIVSRNKSYYNANSSKIEKNIEALSEDFDLSI